MESWVLFNFINLFSCCFIFNVIVFWLVWFMVELDVDNVRLWICCRILVVFVSVFFWVFRWVLVVCLLVIYCFVLLICFCKFIIIVELIGLFEGCDMWVLLESCCCVWLIWVWFFRIELVFCWNVCEVDILIVIIYFFIVN